MALVYRTGFLTVRGMLIRSILFPKKYSFKFYTQSYKFLLVLFSVAIVGACYSAYTFYGFGAGKFFTLKILGKFIKK